jgi:hypothetical protein|tara:strand:- start:1614 stop:2360 length:747 start_codon:yes stop_codon:yes gene_type:complete
MGLKKQIKRIHELLSEGEGSGTASSQSATSTASSGSYESPEAWEQGGILTKDTETEIKSPLPPEVDITDRTTEVITVDIDDVFGEDPLSGILDTLDDVLDDDKFDYDEPSEPYGDDGPKPPLGDPTGEDDDDGLTPTYTKGCPCSPAQLAYLQNMQISTVNNHHHFCCPPGHHDEREEEVETDVNLWRSPPCCEPCEEKQGWWRRCRESEDDNPPCQYATISDCELANEGGESNITPLSLSNLWGEQY